MIAPIDQNKVLETDGLVRKRVINRMQSTAHFFKMRRKGKNPETMLNDEIDDKQKELEQVATQFATTLLQQQEQSNAVLDSLMTDISKENPLEVNQKKVACLEKALKEYQDFESGLKERIAKAKEHFLEQTKLNTLLTKDMNDLIQSLNQPSKQTHAEIQIYGIGAKVCSHISNSTTSS